MIKEITKDITTVEGPAIIVQGVNCQKTMGSGVAKAILEKWPVVKEEYLKVPDSVRTLGSVNFVAVDMTEDKPLVVCNAFTQENYGCDGARYASLGAIAKSMLFVMLRAFEWGVKDIYLPRIGCGHGGLDWDTEVKPLLEVIFNNEDINVTVCNFSEKAA
jgi:O-acetyl-ADP-ribose deacetylase (regulator of RNase III)